MYGQEILVKFSQLKSVLFDDHLFLFTYPSLFTHTSNQFVSLVICCHLFNFFFSNPLHSHDQLLEDLYTKHQNLSISLWKAPVEVHACIISSFDKLVLIFENLKRADSLAITVFLSILRNLVKSRRVLGFRVLNHIFKKYKKECIFISKIFVQEILKALNDEVQNLPKEIVCESFCLVLTLAYLDHREAPENNLFFESVQSCQILKSEFEEGQRFLFDFKNYKNFQVFIPPGLTKDTLVLREYQLEGIKWLNFLWKYELNGILCDDMGLGKTLQSLITVSLQILNVFKPQFSDKKTEHPLEQLQQYIKQKPLIYSKVLKENVALVVCPNNLIYHWEKECKTRINSLVLNPLIVDQKVLACESLSNFLQKCKDIKNFL